MNKWTIKHQVRDVETYKVLYYELENKGNTLNVSTKQLIDYCKDGRVSNAAIFEDSVLYFKFEQKTDAVNFVKYHYSNALKKKMQQGYEKWYIEQCRRQALNIEDDIEYSFEEKEGLYYLTKIMIKGEVSEIVIPSFIAGVKNTNLYYGNLILIDVEKKAREYLEDGMISLYVDRYTDGIYCNSLKVFYDKLELNGLISVLDNDIMYNFFSQNLSEVLLKNKNKSQVRLGGKLRYIGPKILATTCNSLDISAGKHLRVLFVPYNAKSIKCYDTTLIIGDTKQGIPITVKNNIKEKKEALLRFKETIEDIIFEYTHKVEYDIEQGGVTMKFSTQDCLDDFYNFNNRCGTLSNSGDYSLYISVNDYAIKYNNGDNIFWGLKSEVKSRVELKAYEYAFSEII